MPNNMARCLALALSCTAVLLAVVHADDLTSTERAELEGLRAEKAAAAARVARAAPSGPSLTTKDGDVVIAVEDGKKVGYKIGGDKVAYFNDLPQEMRALSGSSAATVAAALQVGYNLGSAKKEVSLTLASVVETMTKVDKKVDTSMANVDKVAVTMTKAVSDATSTLDAMNKKAAVDLAKVTKAVQTDQDALSKKVDGLVTGACDKNKVGLVRYNAKTGDMEACGADNKWAKAAAKIEQAGTKTNPAIDCKAVLSARGKPPSGEYYVTVHGAHPKGVAAFCDMETLGGGWTLFASKKDYNKRIVAENQGKYNAACHAAKYRTANCANVMPVHAWQATTEILFRFNTVDNADAKTGNGPANTWVRHSQTSKVARAIDGNMRDFRKYFFAGNAQGSRSPTVCGFDRRQAWNNDHRSQRGAQCVGGMHTGWGGLISESHGGSDLWIDMWSGRDSSYRYPKTDSKNGGKAQGTKCIAGRCSYDDTILLMFR